MNLRKRFAFRDCKGFALILVFSLASIVLLLALSLVSLTQVESASSRYDQGLRVARANARLALQMAIGDLQEFAGPDQRITAMADGARKDGTGPVGTSFNDDSNAPATSGVYQPFWTGVWNNNSANDDPIWLVTRPLDATYDLENGGQDADPFVIGLGTSNDLVKLVGEGSAKPNLSVSNQSEHDVFVPREPVGSTGIVGMNDAIEAAIGHYAYWVGDNGVKMSYLLQDKVSEVSHDYYEVFDHDGDGTEGTSEDSYDRIRLEQMLAHRNYIEIETGTPDPRLVDASDARLGAIASEFALRELDDDGNHLLGGFTPNDLRRRFHDGAALSHGLLADTVNGGLREDLSFIHEVTTSDPTDVALDNVVNESLMPYLNYLDFVTPMEDLTHTYPISPLNVVIGVVGSTPQIAPVITGFQLKVSMSAKDLPLSADKSSPIYVQYGMAVELWNPYTSRIDGTDLRVVIDNLADATGIVVTYYDNGSALPDPESVNLSELLGETPEFRLDTTSLWWEPGEIKTFTGLYDNGTGILTLTPGASISNNSLLDYQILPAVLSHFVSFDTDYSTDKISLYGPEWTPALSLRMVGEVNPLYEIELSGIEFNELKSSPTLASGSSQPHLSYIVSIRDPDINWTDYNPRFGDIESNVIVDNFEDPNATVPGYDPFLMDYLEYPGSERAFNYVMQSSEVDILGYNSSADVTHNIPLFELPRQEFLSLGALHMAEFPSGLRSHLGMSSADSGAAGSLNGVFDRFFLSTVPQVDPTDWDIEKPLPNGRMEPVANANIVDEESAQHLYLKGAFNINSTSVEAWVSLLKGIRLGSWKYDDPDGVTPGATVQGELDLVGENQFLRFSQSAEETWKGDFSTPDSLDVTRERFRKGLSSYTDAQIGLFAVEIVKGIRARRQATTAPMGPFVSLQDFIDSGVIQTAIAAAGLNIGNDETYTSNYLTQQDVLTAIAPFLSARSDTFVVRAYGDAVNPFDDEEILARAYCEAIVQRTHAKHATDPSVGDVMAATGEGPGEFGRTFKIIAFRWMTGDGL